MDLTLRFSLRTGLFLDMSDSEASDDVKLLSTVTLFFVEAEELRAIFNND